MGAQISSAADWVRLASDAKDKLISDHRFNPKDFCQAGDLEPTICWSAKYPEAWGEHIALDDRGNVLHGWVRSKFVPKDLWLFWPEGADFCGDGYDPECPIECLENLESYQSFDYSDYEDSAP